MNQNVRLLNAAVIVAALGYFVDIYDLVLFSIVRIPSLTALGLQGNALMESGLQLLNIQMFGMLLGGIFWGILGDKKGRLSILFGSIILYSVANAANGLVNSVEMYALLRFIAGIGLAGELGAGITLVAEIMPKETRGYGTMLVASIGVMGALAANIVAKSFDWRIAYFIGGGLGFALLALRVGVYESGMFQHLKESATKRGDFFALFRKKELFVRYAQCIFIGMATWFVVGILITLAPEFARELNIQGSVSAGDAVMFCYIGLIFGDFASGVLSQILKSRRKTMLIFLLATLLLIGGYFFFLTGQSSTVFYGYCILLGTASGYWAIFVTIAAEQFGTNLRATVATTVPNFVRGAVVPITALFLWLKPMWGISLSAMAVGFLCVAIALIALKFMRETFGRDLNYVETL